MYETGYIMQNRLYGKKKRDIALAMVVAVPVVFIVIIILLCVRFGTLYPAYWKYAGKLSDSTYYAYQNGTLRAQIDGETVLVDKRKAYDIYNYLMIDGVGYQKKNIPSADCDLSVDYGNGGILSVWEINETNNYGYDTNKWVSFILYENGDYSYGYLSGDKKLIDMEVKLKH